MYESVWTAKAIGAVVALVLVAAYFGWPRTLEDYAADMGPADRRRRRAWRAVLLALVAGASAVAYQWPNLSREGWPYLLAALIVTTMVVAIWWRCEEGVLHLFQGDSEHERRLRKRVLEVVLLAFCVGGFAWWLARP